MAKLDLTAGGRLNVHPLVEERKVAHLAEIVEGCRLGGYAGQRARTDLAETLSTSDAPFSFAHLINLRNLPRYDEAVTIWRQIATTEEAPDFRPVSFYNLKARFDNLQYGKDNDGNLVAPHVAELDTYQYAFGYVEESAQVATEKRGFKWGVSLERVVNDPTRAYRDVPEDMLRVGIATDEFVVIRALRQGVTAASQFAGGTDYITGTVVPANAPASAPALRVALRNAGQRTDAEGNRIPLASRYYVVVATGEKDGLDWDLSLARGIATVTDNNVEYRVPGDGLGRIAGVLESEYVAPGEWYLVPAAGEGRRPSLVRVTLQGYSAPEVYVSGSPIPVLGGASANPFQAFSWDNDSTDFKFRQFTNGGLISEDQIVWSAGTASA